MPVEPKPEVTSPEPASGKRQRKLPAKVTKWKYYIRDKHYNAGMAFYFIPFNNLFLP